jgi:hypothetical protein
VVLSHGLRLESSFQAKFFIGFWNMRLLRGECSSCAAEGVFQPDKLRVRVTYFVKELKAEAAHEALRVHIRRLGFPRIQAVHRTIIDVHIKAFAWASSTRTLFPNRALLKDCLARNAMG